MTPLIDDVSVLSTSVEYLKIAKQLFEQKPLCESLCRTIVNRCYYSCYLATRFRIGIYSQDKSESFIKILKSHTKFINFLNSQESASELGRLLQNFQARRAEADYNFPLLNLKATFQSKDLMRDNIINEAEKFLEILNKKYPYPIQNEFADDPPTSIFGNRSSLRSQF